MLDLERARELARQIVEEKGEEFIYQPGSVGCVYEHMSAPSCLVGHVLYRDGWSIPELRALDEWGREGQCVPGTNAADLADRFPDRVAPEAAEWLEQVQLEQDDGKTWGYALAHADNMMFLEPDEELPND